jgi:hypothetical protein
MFCTNIQMTKEKHKIKTGMKAIQELEALSLQFEVPFKILYKKTLFCQKPD